MRTHIFLDLEQTVIDTWESQRLINIEQVTNKLRDQPHDAVMHIFSFALWDEKDERNFRSDLEIRLMQALGVHTRFIVHTVDQIGEALLRSTKVLWDRRDLITCLGKQDAFMQFCRSKFDKDVFCVLIDDMVINSVTVDTDFRRVIQTVRI